jgi:nitrogen fixation protein NifZ
MMQAGIPQYAWGQCVQAARDLYNDGSYPDQPLDALLVRSGEAGEVVQTRGWSSIW